MQKIVLIIAIVVIAVMVMIAAIPVERERKRRLQRYWNRLCTGPAWRKRFPDVPKQAIREFLDTFVDGFAFSVRKRLKFSPDDKVMDIYRALYPSPGWADSMELEMFAMNLEEQYGLDLSTIEDHEITLGRLFEITRNPNKLLQRTRSVA